MDELHHDDLPPPDEGGLRPPPDLDFWGRAWWWFHFLILVKLARLRFVAILLAIGLVITQWDTLLNYWEHWTRGANELAAASDVEWFCPMHPSIIRDNPRDKCPICFMPLSKRKKGDATDEALPPGVVNRVQLSPYRIALAGVQTWKLDYVPLSKEITAVGFVEFNERGLRNVSARVKGRIDALYVNETGQMVEAGDELASLYSPELNITVDSLLEARRRNQADLIAASRTRLQLLGIGDDQIDEILRTGKANSHLRIRAPISGHVIKRYVREGQYVDEGSPLMDVADLSTVWIQAQIYEDDIAFLPVDQSHKGSMGQDALQVTATTRAFPNEPFHGKLAFIYPHVDPQTRTVTVRFELENPGHKLRPGSTATVLIRVPPKNLELLLAPHPQDAHKAPGTQTPEWREKLDAGLLLAAPESAIIDTGSQTIVYRESLPGVFEGVTVELGPRMETAEGVTYYPVLHGLAAGDAVAVGGSFLVDAETRLNPAAGSIYFGGSSGGAKAGGAVAVRPSTPEDPDGKVSAALAKLPAADRAVAEAQGVCPILSDTRLGSMGVPVKLLLEGQPVFLCCDGCRKSALKAPAETLQKVRTPKAQPRPVAAKSAPVKEDPEATAVRAELAKLSKADRDLAEGQKYCAVNGEGLLGSMGPPLKVMIDGKPVLLCCEGCRDQALEKPQEMLARVEALRKQHQPKAAEPKATAPSAAEMKIAAALAKLPPADRKLAEAQKYCVVLTDSPLGSMGLPIKVLVSGQPVFICCRGCEKKALADPQATLQRAAEFRAAK